MKQTLSLVRSDEVVPGQVSDVRISDERETVLQELNVVDRLVVDQPGHQRLDANVQRQRLPTSNSCVISCSAIY
ncbi:hypothetical protein Ciccas_013295 [Cichlidogyrus casuarinus]|uniref:Uncharacterized protein n=1 Tax=Cichlidogyrus casuarinus TaxID=1844966 RepID=A0ABD2PL25_9PLAT